jgi:hypothetical protein
LLLLGITSDRHASVRAHPSTLYCCLKFRAAPQAKSFSLSPCLARGEDDQRVRGALFVTHRGCVRPSSDAARHLLPAVRGEGKSHQCCRPVGWAPGPPLAARTSCRHRTNRREVYIAICAIIVWMARVYGFSLRWAKGQPAICSMASKLRCFSPPLAHSAGEAGRECFRVNITASDPSPTLPFATRKGGSDAAARIETTLASIQSTYRRSRILVALDNSHRQQPMRYGIGVVVQQRQGFRPSKIPVIVLDQNAPPLQQLQTLQ